MNMTEEQAAAYRETVRIIEAQKPEAAIRQIAAGIHAIREDTNLLTRTLRTAVVCLVSANLLSARIQSAKTDYERNEAIKEANELLEAMKKSLEEPECQTAKKS